MQRECNVYNLIKAINRKSFVPPACAEDEPSQQIACKMAQLVCGFNLCTRHFQGQLSEGSVTVAS